MKDKGAQHSPDLILKEQEQTKVFDIWCKDQVSHCFVSHLPSRRKFNPLWNVSASDARQQASVYTCAHDSVVFYVVS